MGDFGLAKVIFPQTFATSRSGTGYYMSPERHRGKKCTSASDAWALGCTVYEMCHLRHPFDGKTDKEILDKILDGKYERDSLQAMYSPRLVALIDACLRFDPECRPKTVDLLNLTNVRLFRIRMVYFKGVCMAEEHRTIQENTKSSGRGLLRKRSTKVLTRMQ